MGKQFCGRVRANLMITSAGLALMAAAAPAYAAQADKPVTFEIPAKPLAEALKDYSIAADQQVVYSADVVRDKTAPALTATVPATEGLSRLLQDSGLAFERTDSDVLVIRPLQQQAMLVQEPVRVAQVQEVESREEGETRETRRGEAAPRRRDEITVTGTLIKGIAPESSPVLMFDREEILESGLTTTEQFIRSLPQNFGGGSTEFTGPLGVPTEASAGRNATGGSGANLRGLGSSSTLILLNSRRLAPTSSLGDFVDLSLIPVSALERIDVLTDGASSIYGGDAVAGVINFVLRDDFDGFESAARIGNVTSGEMKEFRIGQTAGSSWESGNVLATYEFFSRENLPLSDRDEFLASGTFSPLRPEAFDLLPEQRRHSAVVSGNQQVAERLDLSLSGLFSHRISDRSSVHQTTGVIELYDATSNNLSVGAGLDYELSDKWSLLLDGSFNKLWSEDTATNNPNSPTEYESGVWSVDLRTSGTLLTFPAGDVRLAIGGHVRGEDFRAENIARVLRQADRTVTAAYAEIALPIIGQANALPLVERLELNVSGRFDHYSDFGSAINPKVGILWSMTDNFSVRGSYGTSFVPPPLGNVGDDFNGVMYPMSFVAGLAGAAGQYPELEESDVLVAVGTDPDLDAQTSRTFTGGFVYNLDRDDHKFSLSGNYYNIDFEDRLGTVPIPGNQSFILAPLIAFDNPNVFPDGTVIFSPSSSVLAETLAALSAPPRSSQGASIENVDIISFVNVTRNLASVETSGLDLSVNYALDSGLGQFSLGGNVNYILDFTRQATSTTPKVDGLNTLFSPVDLRLRGRIGYSRAGFNGNIFLNHTDSYRSDETADAVHIKSWSTIDLSLSYNTRNSKRDWLRSTTFNIAVSNLFNEAPPATPTLNNFRILAYDPTNASPVGRFVSFEIRKAF